MNEIKSTPGPWTAKDESGCYLMDHAWEIDNAEQRTTSAAPIHANGKVVALAVSTEWDDIELDANACLMAASPDMAMALELIAADADAGNSRLTSGVRMALDAALIKAGRKEAPVRTGE